MATTNTIEYVVKDYDSSVDAMINFATINYGTGTEANRLWTDFNQASFSRTWLELVAFMSDIFFFYFDNQATQAYLQTATVRSAVTDIAKQFGFSPSTEQSASGVASFTFTGPGTLARGTRLSAANGSEFYLTSNIVASVPGTYTGTVLQGVIKNETFNAVGLQNEEFTLIGPNVIRDLTNSNPADVTPQVTVNGNDYTYVRSFILSNGTDTDAVVDSLGNVIGGGGRVFTIEERANGSPFIRFGDGIFGRKLLSGDAVSITYRSGGGTIGNIPKATLNSILDTVTFVSAVTNENDFSGGAEEQSIDQLRQLIPANLRTLERAVAEQDYADIILANFPEILAAAAEKNESDPGIDINIYLVPNGIGIPKISENLTLKNNISSFIERRKMVTISFQIEDAFSIDTLFGLKVYISDTASKSTVQTAIVEVFTNYFNLTSGGADSAGINFAEKILSENLELLLKEIPGVERFEFTRHTYRPRIDENVLGLTTSYRHSEVEIYPSVSESEWLVAPAAENTRAADVILFDNEGVSGFTYDSATGEVAYDIPAVVDLSSVSVGDTFIAGEGTAEVTKVITRGDSLGVAEQSKVVTVADEQGFSEVTEITVSDVAANLGGKYFTIYDTSGTVAVWFDYNNTSSEPSHGALRAIEVNLAVSDNTTALVATKLQTALDGDSEFSATVLASDVTVTLIDPYDVPDAFDGVAATGFTFSVSQNGESPNSLASKYFDIYDSSGPVRCWYNIGSSTPPAVPMGGRLLPISISPNASATAVAVATEAAIDLDGALTASLSTNEVTITETVVGTRTNISAGTSGFTVSVLLEGAAADPLGGTYFDIHDIGITEVTSITCVSAASLTGKYFYINSSNDEIQYYVWYEVSGSGTDPEVSGKVGLKVEVASTDTAAAVAAATQQVLDDTISFSASVGGPTVLVETSEVGHCTDATAQTSGFTILVTQQGRNSDTRVWFNSGASTPPTLPNNGRLLEVAMLVADSANTIATKLQTVVHADPYLNATVSTNEVTITDANLGLRTNASAGTSGFTVSTLTEGMEDNDTFVILGVDNLNKKVYLNTDLLVSNNSPTINLGGAIKSTATTYESFKVFKKILATATNLSVDSITDNNLDLSVFNGTATALSSTLLLDNTNIFITSQYASGNYYLMDSASNLWEILANTSNTITTSITAVNDASVTAVASGDYKIIQKMTSHQILFNGSIFGIQYNNDKTLFSTGSQFINIGTIGDSFQICKTQVNEGNLGVAVDLIKYDESTSTVLLNGSPNLLGVSPTYELIDSTGQIFNLVGIDNRALPAVSYPSTQLEASIILKGIGAGQRYAQGFKVDTTTTYSLVSFNLKRSGNIVGNLSVSILQDDGTGKPDLTVPPVAVSNSLNLTSISRLGYYDSYDDSSFMPDAGSNFDKVAFIFETPPTLIAGTQYHLALRGDTSYNSSQANGAKTFDNTSAEPYVSSIISDTEVIVAFTNDVDLSNVEPGHYFRDFSEALYLITAVDDDLNTVTVMSNINIDDATGADSGSIYRKDNIYLGIDNNAPTYTDGKVTSYNGTLWSDLTPNSDAIFSVEGPKSLRVNSNLTPVLGPLATIAERYYDDNQEVSFILGISEGLITSAADVNANGTGTINSVPNKRVDNFVFRTSAYSNDITNLRNNEIPQFSEEDLNLTIFGGVS
jgi:hypothetical protein